MRTEINGLLSILRLIKTIAERLLGLSLMFKLILILIFIICKLMSALAATPIIYNCFTVGQETPGCQIEFKKLDDTKVILCNGSSSIPLTGVTWLFNNQSDLGPGVVLSQQGRSIVIPSSDRSVYGDYSCFNNSTLVNCFSLYLTGIAQPACSYP